MAGLYIAALATTPAPGNISGKPSGLGPHIQEFTSTHKIVHVLCVYLSYMSQLYIMSAEAHLGHLHGKSVPGLRLDVENPVVPVDLIVAELLPDLLAGNHLEATWRGIRSQII